MVHLDSEETIVSVGITPTSTPTPIFVRLLQLTDCYSYSINILKMGKMCLVICCFLTYFEKFLFLYIR